MRIRRDPDRGAAIVETAILVPFVLLLVMGLIDLGRAYSTQITLNNAVSEGALFAAQFPDDHTKTRQRVLDAAADIGLQAGDVTVTCDTSTDPELITVAATLEVDMLTFVGQWFGPDITLTSDSIGVNTRSDPCDPTP